MSMEIGKKSVGCVIFMNNKVLLGRHTYGVGKGLLIIPGGYVDEGETPEEACKRETLEETGYEVEPVKIIGIRFNRACWYVIFKCECVKKDDIELDDENSEVVWLDINEALKRDDVPDLTKNSIRSALKTSNGLVKEEYICENEDVPYSYFG